MLYSFISYTPFILDNIFYLLDKIQVLKNTFVGCLGFMTIWNIVLDGITLINLIMCIGFSVDFSAHFCYHYIDLKHKGGEKQEDTVERTLYSVSKPVIQVNIAAVI